MLSGAAPAPPRPAASLEISVTNLRSDRGLIRFCLTAEPAYFPDCADDANAVRRSIPADARDVRIEGLSPGSYALSVIHDENGNSRLDTFAGIPREGFGFSRNPVIRFGPPRFSAVEFDVPEAGAEQQVRIRYLL